MPVSRKVEADRIAGGKCARCGAKRDGDSVRLCESCKRYMANYKKLQRTERTEPYRNRCTICREPGHNRANCQHVAAIRETKKVMSN